MILSDVCKIYDGTHQTPKYVDEGVPFYSVEHISKNDFSSTKFITEDIFQKECKRVSIEQGDVLMTRIGSVGVPKFVDWNVRASFYVSLALFKSKTEDIHMGWLSYYIQSPNIQRNIWRLTIHVAFPKKINLGDIGKIRMKLPSKSVQTSNYIILRSVDQKINLLTKKKEALETYKKGLMQKIFSQELRFKREDGTDYPEWNSKVLSEVAEIQKGKQLNKLDMDENGAYPVLNGGINWSGFTTSYNTLANTVAISEGGNSCGYVSFITTNFWSGGHNYTLELQNDLDVKYLFHFLKYKEVDIMRLRVGSGLPNIQKKDLKRFFCDIPCLEEQRSITYILDNLDSQIDTTTRKIYISERMKKGLLQQMFA